MFGEHNIQGTAITVIISRSVNTNPLSIVPSTDDTLATTAMTESTAADSTTDGTMTITALTTNMDSSIVLQFIVEELVQTTVSTTLNIDFYVHELIFQVMNDPRLNNITSLVWKLQCS